MKNQIINEITQQMLPVLNNFELEKLQTALNLCLENYEIAEIKSDNVSNYNNQYFIELFLGAKKIEGCSYKTLKYYRATINNTLNSINKEVKNIVTDDLRKYLTKHQEEHSSSRVTIDNIRRILSSFFAWLEDEDYIVKSPVRRIHKIKTGTNIKETYSDEALELMRDKCTELRDLAMIDMFYAFKWKNCWS